MQVYQYAGNDKLVEALGPHALFPKVIDDGKGSPVEVLFYNSKQQVVFIVSAPNDYLRLLVPKK